MTFLCKFVEFKEKDPNSFRDVEADLISYYLQ